MQEIHAVRTTEAPTPLAGAPYSQAVTHAGLVYVSGQIGLDPATGNLVEGIEAQTHQVFKNLRAVAQAGGKAAADPQSRLVTVENLGTQPAIAAIAAAGYTAEPLG